MFEDYKAAQKDFKAIEEGIKTVWHPKLNFVFKNKEFIKKNNLNQVDSVLEPRRFPHDFAFVFGKIIMTLYPKTWPQFLSAPTPT